MRKFSMADALSRIRFPVLLPGFALLAFYCFVVYFRLKQGFWPYYGAPDAGALFGFEVAAQMAIALSFG